MKQNLNNVPIIVQQLIESMLDKNNQPHVRFNNSQSVRAIRDCCNQALEQYDRTQK